MVFPRVVKHNVHQGWLLCNQRVVIYRWREGRCELKPDSVFAEQGLIDVA
ncbi:MAG: hypothetical protein HYX63_12570 [Gammaproteobacteria bacterium]|nr:hypothetical protein [Gammaproteobacteria bacterium]